MTNSNNLQQYADHMKGKISDSSLGIYIFGLRKYLASADGNVLSPDFAQRYVDSLEKLGKSPSTISVRAHAIMSYLRWNKVIVRLDSPTILVKKPEYLKLPEIERAIVFCRTQLERTLVIVLFDTAVRISELLGLRLSDIDWENKIITVIRKGHRVTEVNVSDKAMVELKKWLGIRRGESDRVFLDISYYDAWTIIKNIGKRAGISNMHPHIFRHSRAIQMLRAGVPINIVSQHLGHKSIKTTIDIYGNFTTPDVREQLAPW